MNYIKTVLTTLLLILSCSSNAFEPPIKEVSIQQQGATINVNKATVDELSELKGIGAKKAQAIVSYRENNGKFKSVDDLLKVKGIGEKVIEANLKKLSI